MIAIITIACILGLVLVTALGLCRAASVADQRMNEIFNKKNEKQ